MEAFPIFWKTVSGSLQVLSAGMLPSLQVRGGWSS